MPLVSPLQTICTVLPQDQTVREEFYSSEFISSPSFYSSRASEAKHLAQKTRTVVCFIPLSCTPKESFLDTTMHFFPQHFPHLSHFFLKLKFKLTGRCFDKVEEIERELQMCSIVSVGLAGSVSSMAGVLGALYKVTISEEIRYSFYSEYFWSNLVQYRTLWRLKCTCSQGAISSYITFCTFAQNTLFVEKEHLEFIYFKTFLNYINISALLEKKSSQLISLVSK